MSSTALGSGFFASFFFFAASSAVEAVGGATAWPVALDVSAMISSDMIAEYRQEDKRGMVGGSSETGRATRTDAQCWSQHRCPAPGGRVLRQLRRCWQT